MSFTEGVVLQLHTMLCRYMPQPGGRWKAANNDIVERHPEGSTRLLYRFDYAVGRYISLERIIEESKEGHYESLEASSQGWHEGKHDVKPWLDYFWGALLRSKAQGLIASTGKGRSAKWIELDTVG